MSITPRNLNKINHSKIVEIQFHDTPIIPSMLIGVLLKQVKINHMHIIIKAHNNDLYNLLNRLGLDSILEIEQA